MNNVDPVRTSPPGVFRLYWLFSLLAVICLMGYGLYLEHVEYLDPCSLCITQRVSYVAIGVIAILGILTHRSWWLQRLFVALALLAAISGVITAGRQVWLQHLPPDKVPECGPGLQYWLDNMPFMETLQLLFKGDGNCAEVHWRFLGLSIGEWSLAWFVLFTLIFLRMLFRRRR